MTKTTLPFMDFDLTRLLGNLKADAPELENLMDAQKRNLETIAEANRRAAESFQAIVQRQSDLVREAMTEASGAIASLSGELSPEARAHKQADMIRKSFERTFAAMREIAQMAAKSNAEIYEMLSIRANETLGEFKEATKSAVQKSTKKK